MTLPPGRARLATKPLPTGSGVDRKDDRDDRSRLLECGDRGSKRDDDIDLKPDELGRDLGVALDAVFRPAILDRDGAPLDPAEFASLCKNATSRGLSVKCVAEPR